MKTNMTEHARKDRQSRLEYIIDTVGVGKVAVRYQDIDEKNRIVIFELTTTGVIIVRNAENMVVTAYIAEMRQAVRVWRCQHGDKKMPAPLYKKITQNTKARINQPC